MVLSGAQQEQPSVPLVAVVIVLIVAGIIYSFGYLRAVMHRANRDYRTTKAALPKLRKGFWHAWWAAVKIGFFVVLAIVVLGWWAVRDVTGADESRQPVPAKVSPAPAR
jgi:ABC-type Fe3+ transport system permease subunit